ncbi:MAG: hypothetical protein GY801_41115 [bacterium]|nr:hypothetical protein [bacterium]
MKDYLNQSLKEKNIMTQLDLSTYSLKELRLLLRHVEDEIQNKQTMKVSFDIPIINLKITPYMQLDPFSLWGLWGEPEMEEYDTKERHDKTSGLLVPTSKDYSTLLKKGDKVLIKVDYEREYTVLGTVAIIFSYCIGVEINSDHYIDLANRFRNLQSSIDQLSNNEESQKESKYHGILNLNIGDTDIFRQSLVVMRDYYGLYIPSKRQVKKDIDRSVFILLKPPNYNSESGERIPFNSYILWRSPWGIFVTVHKKACFDFTEYIINNNLA